MTRLHRRQFVIGSRPFRAYDDWFVDDLEDGLYLSRCPDLRVVSSTDRDGRRWHLLGSAVQTVEGRADPPQEIASLSVHEIPEAYRSWAGRWVLIGAGEIHLDACGLLGCFYRPRTAERAQISSSPVLLAGSEGPRATGASRTLRHNVGVDWYPPPRSRFSGVRRLLASQILHAKSGRVERRPLLPSPAAGATYPELLDAIESRLRTALQRIGHEVEGTLWLPLTGGHDSRLLLALAGDLNLRVSTFTQRYRGIPLGDRILPKKLADAVGAPHRLIQPSKWDERRGALYWSHNGRHTPNDLDRRFFARRQWEFGATHDGVLRSGGLEVGLGRLKYFAKFRAEVPSLADLLRGLDEHENSHAAGGLGEWMEWIHGAEETVDWRHRLYLEQRVGGWLSSIEQSLDLVDPERFYPGNAADTYSLLTAVPEERRLGSDHQKDIVRRLAPALDELPYNPTDDEVGWLRGLAYRVKDDPALLVKGPLRKARLGIRRIAGGERS